MPDVLLPRLTALDERVLLQIPEDGRAVRASAVVAALRPSVSETDVLQILRGLEHLGLLRCGRGGWWRRV